MILGKTISVIDSHTAGWPTRIVIGGIPSIPGKTMEEKANYFKENLDFIRTSLFWEPRRLLGGVGAIVTNPTNDEADLGVLFMDADYSFIPTCGSGSMGVITTAIELGMIKHTEPSTDVTLDTISGLITGRAKVQKGYVESVSIRFPPFYLYKTIEIDVPNIGSIPVDIVRSSVDITMAIVQADDIGVIVNKKNKDRLSELAINIRDIVETRSEIKKPPMVRICNEPKEKGTHIKNVTVVEPGDKGVDRSPCGTGTSGHLAALHAKGKIKLNQETTHESIIGTIFKGKAVSTTKVNGFDAVVSEITGTAYTMGINTFFLTPNDPLKYGFSF